MKRLILVLQVLLVLGLVAAQCTSVQPQTVTTVEPAEVEQEAAQEVEVVETEEVATEAPVEAPAEPATEAPAEPAIEGPEGTLTVALTTYPNALDLPNTAERNAANPSWQIYNSLVWVDDEGQVTPALAESWEISDDGREYTFKLRQDVVFHNGEPFNADSVVLSWERGQRPEMQWSDRWTRASSVEKIDDFTVKITTEEPDPLLLRVMAENWAMVPPQYIAEVGEDGFNTHPVGTGPFVFIEWLKGDRIVLEANPNYWKEGLPKVKNLIFRPIPESSTRVAAIQTGEVDIVTRLSAEEAQSLEGQENVQVINYPVDRVFYVTFNNLSTGIGQPTEDPLVRQAMNYAVDVEAIIDALFNGFARQSSGFITQANLGYDESIEPFGYDPDRARELLAEAGYPDGFEIDFACPAGAYTNFEQVCEAVQGYLAEVGIQANLEIMESGQYWDLEAAKELPPLFGDSWSESTGEALPRLIGALGGMNASFSSWSDPEIDRLIGEIGATVDDEARSQLYVELQQYMHENPPFIYLYEPVTFEAVNPRVQNYKPRAAENYYLENTWVLPEE